MKNNFKIIKTLLLIGILTLCIPIHVFASEVKMFPLKDNVETSRVWTITFTDDVLFDNNAKQAIKVLDDNDNPVDVTLKVGQDKNKVLVEPPVDGYKFGEKYTIIVNQRVQSVNNTNLYNEAKMEFNIKNNLDIETKFGNTSGNIANYAYFCEHGDWIYYRNIEDCGRLYKVKKDKSSNIKLSDDKEVLFINVVGDWIYYESSGELCKIKNDGTDRECYRRGGIEYLNVVDDWVYCTTNDKIYKLKTDFSNLTEIKKIVNGKEKSIQGENIHIIGDWIYFEYGNVFCKVNIKGGVIQKVVDKGGYSSNIVDGYIYLNSDYYTGIVYKIKLDGSEKIKISNIKYANFINVSGDYIYFSTTTNKDGGLYRIKKDGTELEKLLDDHFALFCVGKEWIYFYKEIVCENGLDRYSVSYKIRIDGTDEQPISD